MLTVFTQAHANPNAERPFQSPAITPPKFSHQHTSDDLSLANNAVHHEKRRHTAYTQNIQGWNAPEKAREEQKRQQNSLARGCKEWESVGRDNKRRGKKEKVIQVRSTQWCYILSTVLTKRELKHRDWISFLKKFYSIFCVLLHTKQWYFILKVSGWVCFSGTALAKKLINSIEGLIMSLMG